MEPEGKQAQDALQAISQAEAAARRYSPNNGTVPLVWGAVVLVCLIDFDLIPPLPAAAVCGIAAWITAAWTLRYQRQLPVRPLKLEKPYLFGVWALYHAAVLMGGIALETHFWAKNCAAPGTFTLIGLLDSAPLLWVGWQQRRHGQKDHR